jgi:cyclopropane fatty-acyl-phospholipid synthase-like methyltransferase
MAGVVKSQVGEETNQKDYYDKASHYDTLWGMDNIHLGYYPHLMSHTPSTSSFSELDMKQAQFITNSHMINVAGITSRDTVLDIGCGKGRGIWHIAKQTAAKCTGFDLGTTNIKRANQLAQESPELGLTFVEGDMTNIPSSIRHKYSVVMAQLALNHCHKTGWEETIREIKAVMAPGARLVINDYLGGDNGTSEETREHVYKRLHFDFLWGHRGWRKTFEDHGFYIQYYENLDDHMLQSYRQLAAGAYKHGFKSADGALLGDNYTNTAKAIEKGEIGMNIAVLTLEPRSKL